MKSEPTRVTLRSPINGELRTFELIPGVPPTLETLIDLLKFEPVDDPKPRTPKGRKEEQPA